MTASTPEAHGHRFNINIWIAVGVVLALAAALGIGVLIGRSTKTEPLQGLAQKEVVAAIDGSLAALNRGDWQTFATYWAKNAVYEEPGIAGTLRGRQAIVDTSTGYYNLGARYYRISPVIQRGDLAAYVISCPPCPGAWTGIDVARFTNGWKFDHYWTGNTAGPEPLP